MPEHPRGRRRLLPLICGAALAALAGLLVFAPHLLGLGAISGFMHIQSFRLLTSIGVLIVLALLALGLLLRRARAFLAGFLTVGLCAAAVSGGVLLARGLSTTTAPEAGDVRVLSANLLFGAGDLDAVLGPDAHQADVLSLQEADPEAVQAALAARGLAGDYTIATTHLLGDWVNLIAVRSTLEPRPLREQADADVFIGMGTRLGPVYAVHTHAPISRSLRQRAWQESVHAAVNLCGTPEGAADQTGAVLVAGDFNATIDHAPFDPPAGCADAAGTLGISGAGTWPSRLPGSLGAQIDHQVYAAAILTPVAGRILDVPGSDHRGMLIDYRTRTGAGRQG